MVMLSKSEDKTTPKKYTKSSSNQQQLTTVFSGEFSILQRKKMLNYMLCNQCGQAVCQKCVLRKASSSAQRKKNLPHWHKDKILCNGALRANLRSTNSLPLAKTLRNKNHGVYLSLYINAYNHAYSKFWCGVFLEFFFHVAKVSSLPIQVGKAF